MCWRSYFSVHLDAIPKACRLSRVLGLYRVRTGEQQSLRSQLRALSALTGEAPPLDFTVLPADPLELFTTWLQHAVATGVAEPHAMTLSTVGEDRMSGQHPVVALTFWWLPLVRSVRLRGPVIEASREESLADLRARSAAAQQDVDPDDWALWRVQPTRVEFWQGAQDRRHNRIVYVAEGHHWQLNTEMLGNRLRGSTNVIHAACHAFCRRGCPYGAIYPTTL